MMTHVFTRWLGKGGFALSTLVGLAQPLLAQKPAVQVVPVRQPLSTETPSSPTERQEAIQRLMDSLTTEPSRYSNEPQTWAKTTPYVLPVDRVSVMGSYPMVISAHKTSHIIFPAKIKDFDSGSPHILALIPETAGNVLRVKSGVNRPFGESNMTILTEDGGFYSFLVRYDPEPEVLNINIANNKRSDTDVARQMGFNQSARLAGALGAFEGASTVELTQSCATVQRSRKSFLRNVGAAKQKVSLMLQSIYVSGRTMYFGLTMCNASAIDFEMDFLKVYLRDKDVMKRMASQEVELPVLANYPVSLSTFKGQTEYELVYALPLRTFTEDKVLEVELYERAGGRHLRFQIEADVMVKAKAL